MGYCSTSCESFAVRVSSVVHTSLLKQLPVLCALAKDWNLRLPAKRKNFVRRTLFHFLVVIASVCAIVIRVSKRNIF